MFSFEIVSDPYFENVKSYYHETWYKYKTLQCAEKKNNMNVSTLIVEPGTAWYRDLDFRQIMRPSVNVCDHPTINPSVWVCFSLIVAIIKPYMSLTHGPPQTRHSFWRNSCLKNFKMPDWQFCICTAEKRTPVHFEMCLLFTAYHWYHSFTHEFNFKMCSYSWTFLIPKNRKSEHKLLAAFSLLFSIVCTNIKALSGVEIEVKFHQCQTLVRSHLEVEAKKNNVVSAPHHEIC